MQKILVTVDEASELTSLGTQKIRELIKSGIIVPITNGNKQVIPVYELDKFARDYIGLAIGTTEEMLLAKQEVERKRKWANQRN